mgnify:CR=1 FL=1
MRPEFDRLQGARAQDLTDIERAARTLYLQRLGYGGEVRAVGDVLRFEVTGEAGYVPGETATPLAVVLNELLQNAVDHAFPRVDDEPIEGHVRIHLERQDSVLEVIVTDDGVGLPDGFDVATTPGLGTSIVHALVTGELAGTIEMANARDGDRPGTRVRVRIPVPVAGRTVEPPG